MLPFLGLVRLAVGERRLALTFLVMSDVLAVEVADRRRALVRARRKALSPDRADSSLMAWG
jgi:hypothetical protein